MPRTAATRKPKHEPQPEPNRYSPGIPVHHEPEPKPQYVPQRPAPPKLSVEHEPQPKPPATFHVSILCGDRTQSEGYGLCDPTKNYRFATRAERDAFLLGVEAAIGYADYEVISKTEGAA